MLIIDKIHNFLTKRKVIVIIIIIIGLIAGVLTIISFFKSDAPVTINQNITNENQIITININQTIDKVPGCLDCPIVDYHPLELYHNIQVNLPEFEGFNNIGIDLNKIKFNIPTISAIFLDKLPYNERITVGLCSKDMTFCYIFPQYQFDGNDKICMEINVSDSGEWNIYHLEKPIEERKCISLHNTDILLSDNIRNVGLINHFKATLLKEEKKTSVNTNYYKMKMLLPTGQFVYFNEFLYNEAIMFALCNSKRTNCYIRPEYKYTEDDEVCLEVKLHDGWGSDGWTITKVNRSCIQEADTNKFFSEYPECK